MRMWDRVRPGSLGLGIAVNNRGIKLEDHAHEAKGTWDLT